MDILDKPRPAEANGNAGPIANSLQTAAERLDCSVPYLRKKIADGSLPIKRFGRAVRILERDLQAFAEQQT